MHIGNFGLIKVLVVSISFALAICFVGCGDDSSSGATNGDDSKAELNSEAEADTADVSGDVDVSSSSADDADDEDISSDSDDEDEQEDAEEAESSSSSKKSSKSSSSSKKKGKSSSSKAKSSGDDESEDPDDPEDPEDPGVEPAKPESSPSSEGEYPDLSVLNDTTLKQGCDTDKDADVWVFPSFGMNAQKTVYIWRGDEYSISSVVETDLVLPSLCQTALGTVDSTLAGEEDLKRTCDGAVMRVYSSQPFRKGNRDSVYEGAMLLCLEDEESN